MTLRCENTPLYKLLGGKMKGNNGQKQILSTISNCIKEYDNNLLNKKIMFVLEDKSGNVQKEEMFFPKSSFYHLTGTIIKEIGSNNELNCYEVYDKIRDNKLSLNKYEIIEKDNTTGLKLNVLGQLMKIDQVAKMLGNFNNTNILLQTEKIAGNVRACMGFVKDKKSKMYVPNTALQKDIRDITDSTNKIVAILKKGIDEELYCNITYIKNDYLVERILKNNDIKEMIDVDKIYSNKTEINKKILENKNETVKNVLYNLFTNSSGLESKSGISFENTATAAL